MDTIIGKAPSGQRVQHSTTDKSRTQDQASLRQACQDFESVLITHLMKSMRKTVPQSDSMLYGGFSEDIYRSMMDEELASNIARGPGLGLAEILYRQLSTIKKA